MGQLISLGKLEFVMALELSPQRKLAWEKAEKVMDSLKGTSKNYPFMPFDKLMTGFDRLSTNGYVTDLNKPPFALSCELANSRSAIFRGFLRNR